MLEALEQKPSRPWRSAFALASVAAHLALALLLVLSALWKINELGRPNRQIALALGLPKPAGGGSEGTASQKLERPRRQVRDTQPSSEPVKPEELTSAPSDSSGHGGSGKGGRGPGLGIGDIAGTCLTGDCGDFDLDSSSPPHQAEPAKQTEPELVPLEFLAGKRIAGRSQIAPPDDVRATMSAKAQKSTRGSIQMCLDNRGAVETLTVLQSTGYAEYDRELLREMRAWRYQPYRAGGSPVPVCTVVTFIYHQP